MEPKASTCLEALSPSAPLTHSFVPKEWATQDDELEEGDTLKLAVAGALDAGTYTVRFDNGSGAVYAIEVAVSEGATYIFVDTGDLGDDAGSGSYDIDVVDDSGSSLLDSGAASVNISQRLYLHYGLHSPVVATNSDGETVWRRAYLPFGADFAGSPSHPLTIANSSITHGFVGRRSDNDVGLYQLGARWYDPDLGRFVSVDPVAGGINQYAYANNNPFRYYDGDGRESEFVSGIYGALWTYADAVNSNETTACISAGAHGVLRTFYSTGEGVYTMARHPVDTLYGTGETIGYGAYLYLDEPEVLYYGAVNQYNAFLASDPDEQALIGSELAANIALSATGGPKSIGKSGKALSGAASKTSKAAKAARAANKARGTKARKILRKNLGDPPSHLKKPHAHHDLPVEFEDRFNKLGINDINEAQYGRWVEGDNNHLKWSRDFNKEWRKFFDSNPTASDKEVLNFMHNLRNNPNFQ